MKNALLSSVFAVDRNQLRGLTALRCSLGMALCILGYWRLGHLPWGILAGLGSIYAGMASFNGVYQTRLNHIVVTSIAMTVVTILGTLVGPSVWGAILAVTAVAFVSSLYGAMRPDSNLLATQATGTLIILSKVLPASGNTFHAAIGNGLLILSGGASQILSLTLFWPFTQSFPERNAVARVYDSLSDFAGRLAKGEVMQIMEGNSILEARDLMDSLDRYKLKPEQVGLRHALSAAEGIRASLVGLTTLTEEERPKAAAYLFYLSTRLKEVSGYIRDKRVLHLPAKPEVHLPTGLSESSSAGLEVIEALLDHLREPVSVERGPRKSVSDWTHHLSFRLMALESSPSLRLIALRHAARYTITIFAAMCISRFGSFGNGYWIPMTACFILRTDYASTLRMGVARAVGTIVGVIAAVLISDVVKMELSAHVFVVLVCTFGFFTVYRANYAAYSALITLWVIFSISASGVPESFVGAWRLEATLIGIALAFAGYRILPNWQSGRVRDVLCDAAASQVEFCDRVLLLPELPPRTAWERELDRTRALRYEAEAVVESAVKEPTWKHGALPVKDALIDLERNAAKLLGLLAQRLGNPSFSDRVRSDANQFAENARDLVGRLCADAVRDGVR